MNLEMFAIIGLIVIVFFLIQVVKMRRPGSEEITGKEIPAFNAEVSDDKQTSVIIEDYEHDNKLINSDTIR